MRVLFPKSSIAQRLRSFVFGVEDSLVSTVGLLSGIAAGGVSKQTIFLAGVVLIFVEAFSMGVGNYLSDTSEYEYLSHRGLEKKNFSPIPAAIFMFGGYLVAGLVPLLPYAFAPISIALPLSVTSSLICLFMLGLWSGTFTHVRPFKTAIRMFALGGIAILIGLIVGLIVK